MSDAPSYPLQVLLVEDDPADALLVEDAFATHRLPSRLHHVIDGIEAMHFLRREGRYAAAPRPDLVLLDLNMPRLNGREVLAQVKIDEQLKTIPVVVFTTSATGTDILASYAAHANAYITKPLNLDRFEEVIAKIYDFYGEVVTRPLPPQRPDRPADSRAGQAPFNG
ncbi:MAG TPA: response regulator [Micromonosporaceae bacterium]|nr:response regulator [Micromonosporaceae bacterium]